MARLNKSPKYWSSRMDEIMAYVDRTDIDFFDELQATYTEGPSEHPEGDLQLLR